MNFKTEEEQNRYLLFYYLSKTFIDAGATEEEAEQKASEMILKNANNLFGYHGLAYSLGKISLEFFCMYFLQDTFLPKTTNSAREIAEVHRDIWNELESMFIRDEYDKLEAVLPRGIAKTTVCDFAVSVWAHCYVISVYSLVCGRTEADSVEFLSQTKQAFEENQYIIKAFGNLVDSKNNTVNKLELELTNKTKIQALSSTSSIRGKKYNGNRPSMIIADDYQGKADVITEEARIKKYNTWIEDSGFAGDEAVYRIVKGRKIKVKAATKFIVLGTILHADCFMSRLAKNKDYKHIFRKFVDFDIDQYFHTGLWEEFRKIYFNDSLQDPVAEAKEFYYQHESEMQYKTLWPDKYDCLVEAIKYYNNPVSYKQEMMNDASKIGEKWFKSIATQSPERIESHDFVKTMLVADPANSLSKKADSSSFIVASTSHNDFRYIRKGILAKVSFEDFCLKIIELLKKYPDITHVDIEKNLYMGADVLKIKELIAKEPVLAARNIQFINNMQKKNKDDKISTIVDPVNNGQIIFNEEDKDFIEQIKDFAGQDFSQHDDAPDVVAQFDIDVKEIKVIQFATFISRKALGL